MKKILVATAFLLPALQGFAQFDDGFNQIDEMGNITQRNNLAKKDSTNAHHEIPMGLKVWTIDSRFGDRKAAVPDTLSYMYMNTIFTTGLYGQYNTTGNLGAPRLNRIFIDSETE